MPLGMKKKQMRAEKPCRTPVSEFQTEPYSGSYGQTQISSHFFRPRGCVLRTFFGIVVVPILACFLAPSRSGFWNDFEGQKASKKDAFGGSFGFLFDNAKTLILETPNTV